MVFLKCNGANQCHQTESMEKGVNNKQWYNLKKCDLRTCHAQKDGSKESAKQSWTWTTRHESNYFPTVWNHVASY